LLDEGTSPTGPGTGSSNGVTLPNGAAPLDGIEFTITQVTTVATADPAIFSFDGNDYYAVAGGYQDTLTTGDDPLLQAGEASTGTIPVGVYLVVEEASDLVSSPVAPFLVWIPTTVQSTTGDDTLIYNVDVYPKNYDKLDIGKVAVPGGQTLTDATTDLPVNIGDEVDFYITASIPADINDPLVTYALWDEYPAGMDYVANTVVVKAGAGTNSTDFTTTLDETTHYTISLTEDDPGADGGGKLVVTLTPAGRAAVVGLAKIQLKLTTVILDSIPLSAETPNSATIDYTDKNGDNKQVDTDPGTEPEVFSGGYSLNKVDANGNGPLEGAKFKLVKRVSSDFAADLAAADTADGTNGTGYYQNPNDLGTDLVAESDATGYAAFVGIAFGNPGDTLATASSDFWLVEVNAPAGYRLLGAPIEITIDKDSYSATTGVDTYTNSKGFEFPLTGGMGTLLFVVGGIVLIGVAGIVIVSARRKSEKAAQ
jgi:fimbrial isopeptide formation D2 family protein/LPXTG-motif cell wall-anchored protein